MAMSLNTLRQLLSETSGGQFTVTAGQLDVPQVSALFREYLPTGALSLSSARDDVETLSVKGTLVLGTQQLTTTVSFSGDKTGSEVAGIAISVTLKEWKLHAQPLLFSATSVARYLSAPMLSLNAGAGASGGAPAALLTGTLDLSLLGAGGAHQLTAPLAPAAVGASVQRLLFEGRPNVSFGSLEDLLKLVPGADFSLPSDVPIAKTLSLTNVGLVCDSGLDLLLTLLLSVESQLKFEPVAGLFAIESLTLWLSVQFPAGPSPAVYGSLGTQIELDDQFDIDLALSLLESDLFIQGSLDPTTPIALGKLLTKYAPTKVPAIPTGFTISKLALGLGLTTHAWTFELELDDLWSLSLGSMGTLQLERLLVALSGVGAGDVSLAINSRLDLGAASLFLSATENAGTWGFSGGTVGYETIELLPLLQRLATTFGLAKEDLPSDLTALTLEAVQLDFESGGASAEAFTFTCAGKLVVAGVSLASSLNLAITTGTASSVAIGGTLELTVGTVDVQFELKVKCAAAQTLVIGTLEGKRAPLEAGQLIGALGFTPAIPKELNITLEDLGVLYRAQPGNPATSTESAFVLDAKSADYGQALFVVLEQGPKPAYLLAVAPAFKGSLSHIPLIGQELPAALSLSLEGLQLLFTPNNLSADEVATMSQLLSELAQHLPPGTLTLTPGVLASSAQLSLALLVGGTPVSFSFEFGGGARISHTAVAGSAMRAGHWFAVNRSLGPLFVSQVGFDYANGKLEVLLDASLSFSALSISLMGLSASSPLTGFDPTFGLQGLGVSLQSSALTVDGAFISMKPDGLADPDWEYGGELIVETPAFTISGIGAYGELDGRPSFFAFVMLGIPLGGPPYFFVTGLAGGFGYNRALLIPTIDGVASFPLVAAATAGQTSSNPFADKTDPTAALQVMEHYLSEQAGESWFAIGVQFTSFELVKTFALLTVAFGTDFEVAVLGLSSVTVPTGAPDPVGFVEMALELSFAAKTGLLAAAAELTPASYILSSACHLTGGFAFSIWLKDAPPEIKAGDFVVTLGGYNPVFAKPASYPSVPIVGANWQVSSNLAVKGGMYFALTPSAVMAGGYLDATWHSGNLKAWYSLQADFLLSWKPFHYQASIAVSLGVSYRLDLGFASHTFTVHVGASVTLSGPPFSGRAVIDLDVVKFTIEFGSRPPAVTAIAWSEFKASFLPPSSVPKTDTLCTVRVVAGMVKDLTTRKHGANEPDWIIDPESFQLLTNSVAPCTSASLVTGDGQRPGSDQQIVLDAQLPNDFGVGPVGVADGDLRSHHTITLHKLAGGGIDYTVDVHAHCAIERVTANVPRAPWSKALSLELVRNPDIATVNAVPATIPGLVTGYTISPQVRPPDETPTPIALTALGESPAPKCPRFSWSARAAPSGGNFDQRRALALLMTTIAAPIVTATRAGILGELAKRGVPVATSVDVADLAATADQALSAPPWLSLLGERAAS